MMSRGRLRFRLADGRSEVVYTTHQNVGGVGAALLSNMPIEPRRWAAREEAHRAGFRYHQFRLTETFDTLMGPMGRVIK